MERSLSQRAVKQLRWAFPRAARVFPANLFGTSDYDHYGLEARTTWLPNAFNAEVFYPSFQTVKRPWILHASGFTAAKRVPDIIRAFAQVREKRPNAILQLVGDGENRASLLELAEDLLPSGSFQLHGLLSKQKLADLMRQASGFVLASDAETFGCVLMEAMACGCPVLTTQVGGIPAVVREGEGLFVQLGNVDQIADGMNKLLDGTHGLNLERISYETRQRFSRETVGRILHEEYLTAIGFPSKKAASRNYREGSSTKRVVDT
jgi:glycosyltransferase involved in cell wall biosynthesis